MSSLVLAQLFIEYYTGSPVPSPSNNSAAGGLYSFPHITRDEPCPPTRTLFDIGWSCVLTVILCAWTSLHPNVPPRTQARRALWKRIKMMFWSIIAPELILAWAVRQWFAAREVINLYNNRKGSKKWSMIHGHFLIMGGYTLVTDDVNKFEEPEEPGMFSTPEDWNRYYHYLMHYNQCQLGPLTADIFKQLLQHPGFEFPVVTAAFIQDKSKGDFLSKLLAIMQTTFFIVRCIARTHQGLALTELELITLALASFNAITFVFWWNKPLGVKEPVKIFYNPMLNVLEPVNVVQTQEGVNGQVFDVSWTAESIIMKAHEFKWRMIWAFLRIYRRPPPGIPVWAWPFYVFFGTIIAGPFAIFYVVFLPVLSLAPHGIVFLLKLIRIDPITPEPAEGRGLIASRIKTGLLRFRYRLTSYIYKVIEREFVTVAFTEEPGAFLLAWIHILPIIFIIMILLFILSIPFFGFFYFLSFIFASIFGIITSNTVQAGATHVPSFYAPKTASDRYSRMIVFAIFGFLFGGLHCIGWNFTYPTHFEQTLWRVSSLAITLIPVIVGPIDFILSSRDLNAGTKAERQILHLLDFVMTLLLFIYVPVRLSLIAQALALLRDQPHNAFLVVLWTRFLPSLA